MVKVSRRIAKRDNVTNRDKKRDTKIPLQLVTSLCHSIFLNKGAYITWTTKGHAVVGPAHTHAFSGVTSLTQ